MSDLELLGRFFYFGVTLNYLSSDPDLCTNTVPVIWIRILYGTFVGS